MLTVFELLLHRQQDVLLALIGRGLLSPAFSLLDRNRKEEASRVIEQLMASDAYRRVRGTIRRVRWAV